MRTRRSIQFALAAVAALLAAGATFAWAGVLVGGHRADRIGTFEPVAHRLVPAGAADPSAASVSSQPRTTTQPKTTTASPAPTVALTPSYSLAPPSPSDATSTPMSASASATTGQDQPDGSTTPTTDDNGRNHDD